MTGQRLAWAVVAAILGQVLLAIGQPTAYLPVFLLQVASSAALAGLVTCGIRRLQEALTGSEAPAANGGMP